MDLREVEEKLRQIVNAADTGMIDEDDFFLAVQKLLRAIERDRLLGAA
jgi:hypothetical protein